MTKPRIPNHLFPFAILFGATLLAGCSPVGRGLQRVGTNIHEQTVDYDRRLRKWLDSENELAEQERAKTPSTGYCYRTLGDVSCYPRPIPGENHRMVGLQVPEPMFNELNYPIPEERPEAVYIDMAKEQQEADDNTLPPPPSVTVNQAPPLIAPQTAMEPSLQPQAEAVPQPQEKPAAPKVLMPAFAE